MKAEIHHQFVMIAKTCMVDILKVKAITNNGEGLEVQYLGDPVGTYITCPNPDDALWETFEAAKEKAMTVIADELPLPEIK